VSSSGEACVSPASAGAEIAEQLERTGDAAAAIDAPGR
jgi:hypothetical protein